MQEIDKIWDNRTPLKKTKTKKQKKSTTRAIASRAKNNKARDT